MGISRDWGFVGSVYWQIAPCFWVRGYLRASAVGTAWPMEWEGGRAQEVSDHWHNTSTPAGPFLP